MSGAPEVAPLSHRCAAVPQQRRPAQAPLATRTSEPPSRLPASPGPADRSAALGQVAAFLALLVIATAAAAGLPGGHGAPVALAAWGLGVAWLELAWAGALLARFDTGVTVLNVVDRLLLVDELTGLPTADALQRLQEEATTAMREWLAEQVHQAGLPPPHVVTEVLVGDPSYQIIAEADRLDADLVLVGSKGGDVARTPLIGRIVNRVVRNAPCSVLVVPGRRGADAAATWSPAGERG